MSDVLWSTVSPKRKADVLADDLLARIVRGEIEVGALLPRESELAAHYDVNRSVVREAVKKLEVHRLVRPVRRRGTVVLDPLASLSPEVLRAMLAPGGRVAPQMLSHLLEIRARIDVEMNGLAALRRRKRDLAALRACVAELERSTLYPRRYAEAMHALSLVLARATQNPIFEMLVHWHRHVYADLEDLFLLVRFPSEPHLQGVQALCAAIERRDPAASRELTERFHEWATPVLLAAVGKSKEKDTWST
jgi:GntR family transcriptional repressor for pyruvate dehydrogenase complex